MTPFRLWGLPSRVATGGVAAAAALALMTLAAAVRLDPLPAPAAGPDGVQPLRTHTGSAKEGAAPSESWALSAVARDPFRPDRQRPAERYLLPNERAAVSLVRPPTFRARLVGTILEAGTPQSAAAALQVPGQPPRVVHLGEIFEGYRLVRVEAGLVALAGPDSTVTLRLDSLPAEPVP